MWRGGFDFGEGEDFVFAAGGEGADGFAGGVGGAFFVTVFLLGVAGAFEEMVDHFAAFMDLELDGPIWALIVCVAVVSEADDVAFGVGECYVAGVGRGFGQFVIAAGLDHLVGGEGGGEEVGDVDGMDGRCCLSLGGEGEDEEKGEGYNCFCVGHG